MEHNGSAIISLGSSPFDMDFPLQRNASKGKSILRFEVGDSRELYLKRYLFKI